MKPIKLHTKVTVLTACIIVIMLTTMVGIITTQIKEIIVQEQREHAELAALSLALETGRQEQPQDPDRIQRETTIVRNARGSFTAVRIYELMGDQLNEIGGAQDNQQSPPLKRAEINQLKRGEVVRLADKQISSGQNNYRVLAPIRLQPSNSVIGAVEVVVTLQPALEVAGNIGRYMLLLLGIAVAITLFSAYLMMRAVVYKPIRRLLQAIQQIETGNLSIKVEPRAPDEIGVLSLSFNRMIERLRVLSDERERQRQNLAEEVAKARQELWSLTRQMSVMERLAVAGQTAALFAHEVGTPLHIVNGQVQLLAARSGDDAKTATRLQTITEQVKRIETIVRSMLDRTRMPTLQTEDLSVNSIVEKISEAIAPSVAARNVKLIKSLDTALPVIKINSERLQQALLNLINNALDATPAEGEIKLKTYYNADDQQVIIEVADTGCGMTDDVAAHIFDPLYTTKERGRGTGLGLVIVQQVAREHNGRIDFETNVGNGTTFRLRIPV